MGEISVFDVIGPRMIGPSSSHTAGALRIAQLARRISGENIKKAVFRLYGSFASTYRGHGTDRALVAGILGCGTEDPRIPDAFTLAKEMGLEYSFIPDAETETAHPNTLDIEITSSGGKITRLRGVSTGGGNCRIDRINGIDVSLSGGYHTLLIRQRDTFGIVASITRVLSQRKINIAFMRMYRENKGKTAYTIIETDDAMPPEVSGEIFAAHGDIEDVIYIPMGE